MDVKGPFPKRMLKKGAFTMKHFEGDPGMSFKLYEDDPVTRQPVRAPQTAACFRVVFKSNDHQRTVYALLHSVAITHGLW